MSLFEMEIRAELDRVENEVALGKIGQQTVASLRHRMNSLRSAHARLGTVIASIDAEIKEATGEAA